jgi:hypothetical protein
MVKQTPTEVIIPEDQWIAVQAESRPASSILRTSQIMEATPTSTTNRKRIRNAKGLSVRHQHAITTTGKGTTLASWMVILVLSLAALSDTTLAWLPTSTTTTRVKGSKLIRSSFQRLPCAIQGTPNSAHSTQSTSTCLPMAAASNSNNTNKKKSKKGSKTATKSSKKRKTSKKSAAAAAAKAALAHTAKTASMQTALCILPPADAWDNLQRARHKSRDRSYTRWPPCIRLFHPFCPPAAMQDTALQLAEVIERYNIQPFTIHFDQWMVIPHTEAMEADWLAMQQMQDASSAAAANDDDDDYESYHAKDEAKEEFEKLVAREEELGRRNRRNRQLQALKKQARQRIEQEGSNNATSTSVPLPIIPPAVYKAPETIESHRELLEKQKRMYEEFNGPCVVSLEPDEESKEKLIQLRELLRRELFSAYDKYSPSSTVSDAHGDTLPRAVLELDDLIDYRPLVTVGSFPTVSSAIETARTLRSLWDPLTFDVMDLQLISCVEDSVVDSGNGGFGSSSSGNSGSNNNNNFEPNQPVLSSSDREGLPFNVHKTSWLSHAAGEEERNLQQDEQFGCDAMVMLMGEEELTDQELTQEMVDFVCEKGEAGGFENDQKKNQFRQTGNNNDQQQQQWNVELDSDNGNMEDLENWLDQDDETVDEGTVVVIGRTHFFTGEMRKFVGMPATSVMDAKDRAMGVSGAARRRGAIHRGGNLWEEGEWGRKDADLRPKTKNKPRE